jgi:hypothetical protein
MRTLAGKRKKKKNLIKGNPARRAVVSCIHLYYVCVYRVPCRLLRVCVPCTVSFTTTISPTRGVVCSIFTSCVPCTVYRVPCTESFTTCVCTVYRVVYYNYFTYKGGRLQHLYFVCTVYRVPCTVYRVPCTVYFTTTTLLTRGIVCSGIHLGDDHRRHLAHLRGQLL